MKELNITKAQLIRESGLTRVTIDKVLSGGNINVDTIEALAKGLGVGVGFFFDDTIGNNGQVQTAGTNSTLVGRDLSIGSVDASEHDELIKLREEVKFLKEFIAEKNERIAELKERIDELKINK